MSRELSFANLVKLVNLAPAVPFQCKMDNKLRRECINCASKPKEENHPMLTFRDRVLCTCDWDQEHDREKSRHSLQRVRILIGGPPPFQLIIRDPGGGFIKSKHRVKERFHTCLKKLSMK
jgi:hypothetical protein